MRPPEAPAAEAVDPFESMESGREAESAALERTAERVASERSTPAPVPSAPAAPLVPVVRAGAKDQLLQDIESALSEGLEDIYRQLPPDRRKIFKTRGEKLAEEIRGLVVAAKAEAKRIFQLVLDWLKTLPGVSRFFLEQEAKIKTDKILTAAAEERRRGLLT